MSWQTERRSLLHEALRDIRDHNDGHETAVAIVYAATIISQAMEHAADRLERIMADARNTMLQAARNVNVRMLR